MIKGNRIQLEQEINDFIQTEALVNGKYLVEAQLQSSSYNNDHPYILYMGCGLTNSPAFILGICNQHEDSGAVIISHQYKPRSYMIAFTEAVKGLFMDASIEHKRAIIIHFGQVYRRLIEDCFGEGNHADLLDLSLLEVFENVNEIEEFLQRERL